MKRFLEWLGQPKIAVITTIVFMVFMIVVLPRVSTLTESRTGVSDSPDTILFYSISSFYEMLDSYGEEGRSFYILMRWTFDLIWPLVYGLFLVSTIGVFSTGVFKTYQKRLMVLPLIAVDLDYFENLLATLHMALYPSKIIIFVPFLQVVSLFKWIMVSASFIVLILLIGYTIFNTFKSKE